MTGQVQRFVETARRAIPGRVVPAMVDLQTAIWWARPSVREEAVRQMTFLLETARPDADIEAAARAYVRWMLWRGHARWSPELVTRQRVVGGEHLVEAHQEGRGVLMSTTHHGSFDGLPASMTRATGLIAHLTAYPTTLSPDAPGWLQQHVRVNAVGGNIPVSVAIGSAGMRELLSEGKIVFIASDVPGSSHVRFAGKEVRGSSGVAYLAASSDAPVVVVTTEVDDDGTHLRAHPAVYARDFGSPKDLLTHLLGIHEASILRLPEAVDIPTSRWGLIEADPERTDPALAT